jgi:hypothetical protein
MPLTTVDNTAFDIPLAAYAAPYGPLTRTGTLTDLDTNPMISPNSNIPYHVKSATGVDVYISYDQLAIPFVAKDIVEDAHGEASQLLKLEAWVAQLTAIINHANFNALDASPGALQMFLKAFQALTLLGIRIPFEGYPEVSPDKNTVLNAAFSVADVSDVITVTNTSTGKYHFGMIYWGDGHTELIDNVDVQPTIVHDYAHAGAATYTIRMWLIGYNGESDVATGSATIT